MLRLHVLDFLHLSRESTVLPHVLLTGEAGFTHAAWSELELFSSCSCSDQALGSTRHTWCMYLITLFCSSWPSFSLLYLLFSTPASFQIKNLPRLCFPHWSQFCCLHTHIKYFCYYCYLDDLGPETYRCFSSPGPAWPWKILLPCSYLSGLAISYNSSSATCEIQPVLMDLLSASHTGIQHIQQFLTSGSFSLTISFS